jgi:glutamate-ammonia-ligase adenylyltransferase
MRARIDREFGTTDIWNVKYVRGGTIDIEFIIQHLILRHGHAHPEVDSTNSLTALERLAAAGLIESGIAADLAATLALWLRLQGFLRLTTDGKFEPDKAPEGLRRALMQSGLGDRAGEFDFAGFEYHLRQVAARTHTCFRELIEAPAAALAPASHP